MPQENIPSIIEDLETTIDEFFPCCGRAAILGEDHVDLFAGRLISTYRQLYPISTDNVFTYAAQGLLSLIYACGYEEDEVSGLNHDFKKTHDTDPEKIRSEKDSGRFSLAYSWLVALRTDLKDDPSLYEALKNKTRLAGMADLYWTVRLLSDGRDGKVHVGYDDIIGYMESPNEWGIKIPEGRPNPKKWAIAKANFLAQTNYLERKSRYVESRYSQLSFFALNLPSLYGAAGCSISS